MTKLGPKDRKLMEEILEKDFDRTANMNRAKRIIDLSGRVSVSKKFNDRLYQKFKEKEYVI